MFEPIVICGFPGIGKSCYANNKKDVEDMESSLYGWVFDDEKPGEPPVRNPDFPANYVRAIKIARETRRRHETLFILAACHQEVREELKRSGVPYIVVVPDKDAKDEYLKRYLTRGSDIEFIQLLNKKWDEWLDAIEEEDAPVIHLNKHQTLSDLLQYACF